MLLERGGNPEKGEGVEVEMGEIATFFIYSSIALTVCRGKK